MIANQMVLASCCQHTKWANGFGTALSHSVSDIRLTYIVIANPGLGEIHHPGILIILKIGVQIWCQNKLP